MSTTKKHPTKNFGQPLKLRTTNQPLTRHEWYLDAADERAERLAVINGGYRKVGDPTGRYRFASREEFVAAASARELVSA